MSEDLKKTLQRQLWSIADELRGKMNADEFRDYILGFIFYKYLSEKMLIHANDILSEDNLRYDELNEELEEHFDIIEEVKEDSVGELGFFLRPSELFSVIAKRGNNDSNDGSNFIIDDLTTILRNIEQSTMGTESEEDYIDLFEDLDLTSTKLGKNPEEKNTLIVAVLAHLDKIDFRLEDTNADVLGDAYEYLIGQFASGAGKKAGEFYTPQQVSKILAKLVTVNKSRLKSVYDPTCGSGSLLLRVAKEVEVYNFFGQELNRTTFNLARMNMILHDVHYRRFSLEQDDTLLEPKHIDKRFEAIVANPPFSAKWKPSPLTSNDERFSQYGRLAPKSKADFAFVQHMIHHLDDNGTMACVLPHGVLFRGAAEGHIREYLIKNRNYLDAVIGLPANIFYGTSIPTCVLVFKKCREVDDNILFIDASQHFEKDKNQNILTDEHVNKIVDTYKTRTTIDKYSYTATLEEIAENDYNLNIPRYVDTFEEEDPIDLSEVSKSLKQLNNDMAETDRQIADFCEQLGIDTPF